MARLLACWELGLGLGHLAKLAPAARALAGLGHESWLAARDVTRVAAVDDGAFAKVLAAPQWLGRGAANPTLGYGQLLADGGFGDDDGLVALVRAWLAMFELVQPAAIYGDHAPASLLAAHVAGLPAARFGTPFTCPPAMRPLPGLMPWLAVPQSARTGADVVADRVVRSVCRAFGAPVLAGLAELLGTAPAFLASWPEMNCGPARRDSAWYGPLGGVAGAAPDWPDVPPSSGPRVFVYMPFDRAAAAPLAAALGQRGWPVIWMCATPPDFALPGSIRHVAEPVDITAVLASARLYVGRGSHGAGLEAIRAGCPQLLVPDDVESRTLALALASHGIARLATAWEAGSIGAALDDMVVDSAPERGAAAAVAARHAGHDGATAAARLGLDMALALRLATAA